jgi:hypothetical protein
VAAVVDADGNIFLLFPMMSGLLLTVEATRSGLLALAVTLFVWNVLEPVPATLDFQHWSAAATTATLSGIGAVAAVAFVAARAGRPLFGSDPTRIASRVSS